MTSQTRLRWPARMIWDVCNVCENKRREETSQTILSCIFLSPFRHVVRNLKAVASSYVCARYMKLSVAARKGPLDSSRWNEPHEQNIPNIRFDPSRSKIEGIYTLYLAVFQAFLFASYSFVYLYNIYVKYVSCGCETKSINYLMYSQLRTLFTFHSSHLPSIAGDLLN